MKRTPLLCLLSIIVLGLVGSGALKGSPGPALGVRSAAGEIIRVFDETGARFSVRRPDGSRVRLTEYARSVLESAEQVMGIGAGALTALDPAIRSITHEDPSRGIRVEPDGRIVPLDGSEVVSDPAAPDPVSGLPGVEQTTPPTIDRMTTTGGYYWTYQPGLGLGVLGRTERYYLSDGTSWQSGAGTARIAAAAVLRVEVSGNSIRCVLSPPPDGVLFQQTDFNAGDHSSQGTLGVAGPLVIETVAGTTTAILRGQAEILSNDATFYGDRFNYFSAPVGAIVPFEVTYTLLQTTWSANLFTTTFFYTFTGVVDFAHPISVPRVTSLEIAGSAQVPSQSSAQFFAAVVYENGVRKNVTDLASWSVEPASIASIERGLLSAGSPEADRAEVILRATYAEGGFEVQAEKRVLIVVGGSADLAEIWEMYQADSRHSGWVPVHLQPESFAVRWQRQVGGGRPLNPVTAADGRVFVSVLTYFGSGPMFFALDVRDGETLWSKEYDDVFSVNPPSYAYGNVYIQTGNHSTDTWLRAYDAATGDPVFQAPHAAQWERYYAPTIFDGAVYVNGGSYGGMYAFDAFSGQQRWFRGLPQYDEWTPAVDERYAYAYVGEYSPGLYVVDRRTGALVYTIPDRNFDWNGWSMDLAPVLGGANDVLAIHDGRLIFFDTASRSIRWEIAGGFVGQPSVAHGVIYAMRYGALVALDEESGAEAWSWRPPSGALSGALIVTESHVIASTGSATYAIDLLERRHTWTHPAGGHLALGDDMLYIASANGSLTAVSMPGFAPSRLVSLEITGPSEVVESSTARFSALASYDDGRVRDRTLVARWSIDPAPSAAIDTNGVLTTTELFTPAQPVAIHAAYTEDDVTLEARKTVNLVIGVTLDEFILRNLAGARDITQQILEQLRLASMREEAARAVLLGQVQAGAADGSVSPSRVQALNDLVQAINWARLGRQSLNSSASELEQSMTEMTQGGAAPALRSIVPWSP